MVVCQKKKKKEFSQSHSRIGHGTEIVLYDGGMQLKRVNIQSALTRYKRVKNMFGRGARDNFMASFNVMSFHFVTHFSA